MPQFEVEDPHAAVRWHLRTHGVVRAKVLLELGMQESDIRRYVRRGVLTRIARGTYTSRWYSATANRMVAAAAVKVPRGVLCLLSALHLHGLLAERPPEVWMALPEKAWRPCTDDLPVRIVWFGGAAAAAGIETRVVEGVDVPVYSAAKSVADCVKYRAKISDGVALRAVSEFRQRHPDRGEELLEWARVCRVRRAVTRMLVRGSPSPA